MAAQHTPGPWSTVEEEADEFWFGAGYVGVCDANGLTVAPVGLRDKGDEQARADARLIAAAPDLLEALTALVGRCSDCGAPALGFAIAQNKNVCAEHKPSAGGYQAYGSLEEIAARAAIAAATGASQPSSTREDK